MLVKAKANIEAKAQDVFYEYVQPLHIALAQGHGTLGAIDFFFCEWWEIGAHWTITGAIFGVGRVVPPAHRDGRFSAKGLLEMFLDEESL